MPVQVNFEWQETEETVLFTLDIPRLSNLKTSAVRTVISPAYIRVSVPPYFFEADLYGEIDELRSVSTISKNQLFLRLVKKVPRIWKTFSARENPQLTKEELLARRQASLEVYEENLKKHRQQLAELKHEKHKQAQEEQWRVDRETREWLEKQKEIEKTNFLRELYSSDFSDRTNHPEPCRVDGAIDGFHEEPLTSHEPRSDCVDGAGTVANSRKVLIVDDSSSDDDSFVVPPKDGSEKNPRETADKPRHPARDSSSRSLPIEEDIGRTEQHVCNAGKENVLISSNTEQQLRGGAPPQKKTVRLSFTARKHHRLPARGEKIPPFPKNATQPVGPRKDKGASHEGDPEWLKQKGDKLLRNRDMKSAIEAYSAALKIASSARCFANRAQCHLLLGDFDKVSDTQPYTRVALLEVGVTPRAALSASSALWLIVVCDRTSSEQFQQLNDVSGARVRRAAEMLSEALVDTCGLSLAEAKRIQADLNNVRGALAHLQDASPEACLVDCDAAMEQMARSGLAMHTWSLKHDWDRALSSPPEHKDGEVTEEDPQPGCFVVTKASEPALRNVWLKLLLRRSSALEQLGRTEDALGGMNLLVALRRLRLFSRDSSP
ncbi:hypothetical protein CSUI_000350 [Cystoisospora suis]|uniref:Dynein axonemal assembly factor 4 n=1 Tax=Cystoisospora suis TaxID=483139 RepID=A0A2C6LED4_9APIC|nr:hypothetical protein CSUI_000350 [Cystoisospora suis]